MRCKFREQASTAIQSQADNLSFAMTQVQQCIGKTQKAALAVLLGLGGVWVTLEVISPQVAQADTKRLDLTLERQPNETYETLLRRAEAAALAAAQASFDQDNQVTDVSVIIVAQNQGAIAPVLSLEVSRPNPQPGVTYFTSARALLQFDNLATTTPGQTRTTNPATSPGQGTNRTYGQPRTTNPTTPPGQSTNRTFGQPGTTSPTTPPGQTPSSTFGQPGTTNPNNTPGQTPSSTFGQPGTTNPNNTPGQTNNTNAQPGTNNTTDTPSQTPQPGTGMTPQAPMAAPVAPAGTQSPTSPNLNSVPSSTPTSGSQNSIPPPSTSGTPINNASPTSVPNSSSNTPSNNPFSPTTPNTNSSGSVNTTPGTTPSLNAIPDESSLP